MQNCHRMYFEALKSGEKRDEKLVVDLKWSALYFVACIRQFVVKLNNVDDCRMTK